MDRKKLGTGVMFADVILYNFDSLLFFRTFVYCFYKRLSHNIEAKKTFMFFFVDAFAPIKFFGSLFTCSIQFCNTILISEFVKNNLRFQGL